MFDKVKPRFLAAVKKRKDVFEVWWDLAGFVQTQLSAGPVNQLQVLIQRQEQATAVGKSASGVAVTGMFAGGFKSNGSQPASAGAVFGLSFLGGCGTRGRGGLTVGDAVVEACKFAGFRSLRDGGADRVEVNLGHAGDKGGFVEEWLSLEAGLPEVTGDFIFAVGTFGDRFGNALHEPGDAAESTALVGKAGGAVFEVIELFGGGLFREPGGGAALRKQGPPAACDFVVGPRGGDVRASADDEVHVVGHECIAERFDGEDAGQFFEAAADPFAAV